MTEEIAKVYQLRKEDYEKQQEKAQKLSNNISFLRITIFVSAAVPIAFGLMKSQSQYYYLSLPILALFILSIHWHNKVKDRLTFLGKLISINKASLLRLSGKWTTFSESGEQFANQQHPYSTDLNIFGQGSLFQYINTTFSFTGEQALVNQLSIKPAFAEIKPRQESVSDLAPRIEFRQNFQAAGSKLFRKNHDPGSHFSCFVGNSTPHKISVIAFLCFWLVPFISLVLLLAGIFHYLPIYYFSLSLPFLAIAWLWGGRIVQPIFDSAGKAIDALRWYVAPLRQIEKEEFNAPFLIDLKKKLFTDSQLASRQINNLSNIADRMKVHPMVLLILNIAVMWNWYTLTKLERWKRKSGKHIKTWFKVVGEYEALSSLALMAHDNPDWVFPTVEIKPPFFQAKSLGHPLIHRDSRVDNSVSLPHPGKVLLITGSNMSGKSTLLRTVGINLVLAYAGAPVCSGELSCSFMNIYSKMQIHDNLEEKVSTFYAELKRMKMIIDSAQTNEPLIFLLDEIFRGTNSRDRIFATRNVIKKLMKLSTIGLITTHDLELSVLEKEHPENIVNYHFTDEIDDNQIHFDYKLKPGVSKTANAIALMKMIGIGVEE